MNAFLRAAATLITRHGRTFNYKQVQEGIYDPATGNVTNTEVVIPVLLYKEHIKATQYNYPNLIGKDSAMFYLAGNALGSVIPDSQDLVEDATSGEVYTVESVMKHEALGSVALYRLVCVKG